MLLDTIQLSDTDDEDKQIQRSPRSKKVAIASYVESEKHLTPLKINDTVFSSTAMRGGFEVIVRAVLTASR